MGALFFTPRPAVAWVELSADPQSGQAPLLVSFSWTACCGEPPFSVYLAFGDGTYYETQCNPDCIGDPNFDHVYEDPGLYTAEIGVVDSTAISLGLSSATIEVSSPPPPAPDWFSVRPGDGWVHIVCSAPLYLDEPYTLRIYKGTRIDQIDLIILESPPFPSYDDFDVTNGVLYYYECSIVKGGLEGPPAGPLLSRPTAGALTAIASGSPATGSAPLSVAFSGAASGGNPPYFYFWDFGDGVTSTQEDPTHIYSQPGQYVATLTVSDTGSAEGMDVVQIRVEFPGTAGVEATATPLYGYAPLTVTFNATAHGGTPPYGYLWRFGDGSSAEAANWSHTYTQPGFYVVNLTVWEGEGFLLWNYYFSIHVLPSGGTVPVTASISPSTTSGPAPLTVFFVAGASGGTPPYSYSWAFGDGATGTGASVSHTFTAAGDYVVTVSVTDNAGDTASDTATISGSGGPTPVLSHCVVSPPSSALGVGDTQPFSATGFDGGTSIPGAMVTWTVNGGIGSVSASGLFTAMADGSGTVEATVSFGGNSVVCEANVVVAGTGGPRLTVDEPSAGEAGLLLLSGTATPGSVVNIRVDGGPPTSVAVSPTGTWSHTQDTSALSPGTHTISFQAIQGGQQSPVLTRTFTATGSGGSLLPLPWWLLLLLAAVVVAAIAVALLLRSRRRRRAVPIADHPPGMPASQPPQDAPPAAPSSPAPGGPAEAPPSPSDMERKLAKLKEVRDRGLITKEQYEESVMKLLEGV